MFLLCLYAQHGTDLRRPLRAGASTEMLLRLIRAVWENRADRGAEERRATRDRETYVPLSVLRRDAHLEMHTRGGWELALRPAARHTAKEERPEDGAGQRTDEHRQEHEVQRLLAASDCGMPTAASKSASRRVTPTFSSTVSPRTSAPRPPTSDQRRHRARRRAKHEPLPEPCPSRHDGPVSARDSRQNSRRRPQAPPRSPAMYAADSICPTKRT